MGCQELAAMLERHASERQSAAQREGDLAVRRLQKAQDKEQKNHVKRCPFCKEAT
jgi:hypothetical protein